LVIQVHLLVPPLLQASFPYHAAIRDRWVVDSLDIVFYRLVRHQPD